MQSYLDNNRKLYRLCLLLLDPKLGVIACIREWKWDSGGNELEFG